jgi:hypothetical protein
VTAARQQLDVVVGEVLDQLAGSSSDDAGLPRLERLGVDILAEGGPVSGR